MGSSYSTEQKFVTALKVNDTQTCLQLLQEQPKLAGLKDIISPLMYAIIHNNTTLVQALVYNEHTAWGCLYEGKTELMQSLKFPNLEIFLMKKMEYV